MFLLLAFAVERNVTRQVDEGILKAVRALTLRDERTGRLWGEESVVAITSLGSLAVLIAGCCTVLVLLLFAGRWSTGLFLAVVLSGAAGLNYGLKPLFGRARPEIVRHVQLVDTLSFPSGHALISTSVYLGLLLIGSSLLSDRRSRLFLRAMTFLLIFLVGVSRIYLGVHYPTDVLAGWTLGLVWFSLCWLLARSAERREKLPPVFGPF